MWRLVAGGVLLGACYDPQLDCPLRSCNELVGDSPSDATSIVTDAGVTDAATPCAPGCAGTCDDGVCVLECLGAQACEDEVVCPLFGPCRVTCTGRKACEQGVRCGLGRCTVACNGDDACRKRVRCEASCACDVTCGPDACKDDAVCPFPWCEAAGGCTSTPNSCARC